jgi:hypothetical protein
MAGNGDNQNLNLPAYGMIPYLKRTPGKLVGIQVGVAGGENIHVLCESVTSIQKIYGIDPNSNTDLSHLNGRYEHVKKNYLSAVNDFETESIDFVLSCGDYTYDVVTKLLGSYYPLLKSGGFMFVHGIDNKSVIDAVLNFRSANRLRMPLHKSKNYVDFWQK